MYRDRITLMGKKSSGMKLTLIYPEVKKKPEVRTALGRRPPSVIYQWLI